MGYGLKNRRRGQTEKKGETGEEGGQRTDAPNRKKRTDGAQTGLGCQKRHRKPQVTGNGAGVWQPKFSPVRGRVTRCPIPLTKINKGKKKRNLEKMANVYCRPPSERVLLKTRGTMMGKTEQTGGF